MKSVLFDEVWEKTGRFFSFFLQIYAVYMCACVWNELCRLSPSLKKRLMSGYSLDKVAAIQWGIMHESTALGEYHKMGAQVDQTGNRITLTNLSHGNPVLLTVVMAIHCQ